MLDLFGDEAPWQEPLADGAAILRRRAREAAPALLEAIAAVAQQNPFHHRITPCGHRMSVAMTNCGDFGWSSDARGYQYTEQDAENGRRCFASWRSTARARRAFQASSPTPA
nr:Alpha-ketoglutarate-dependent dioxygenase AlkB [Candidatus Pantoea persica]